ncbi:hypothetical protein P691DRAFT_332879 [Macrolepiota fuliginosa MF-IS2]|uniref:Uncharacterized protein n=1 Tax=Macrolepiota fuliginosa MF-IS2 TaxID=1400762 RepID=A0A9P5X883_9AGAR|nr:hypothetical protein P691DRAFT_332879 [Macrolepiota fuliginosa MF-IS2]
MFYAYDVKPGETSDSPDHDARLHKRKIPRLALSTDVKTLQRSRPHLPPTSMPSSIQMPLSPYYGPSRVDGVDLYSHRQRNTSTGRLPVKRRWRGTENMDSGYDSGYGAERHNLDSAYPALLPSSRYNTSAMACTAESSSRQQSHRSSPSYPQHPCDTRPDKIPYSCLQPTSFYPSPPQSTAVSPLEVFNPLPPPIQPPPSLPLHQPRPSRRIPIISLSQLASACDGTETTPQPKLMTTHKLGKEISWDAPYSTDFGQARFVQEVNGVGRFVQCSCGCMESYAIG